MRDEKSLAHTRWNCKYHIVFAPKYRRQVFYREKRRAIGSILRKLCEWKNVNILKQNTVWITSICFWRSRPR
ncbi:transposase [Yersinia pestis]